MKRPDPVLRTDDFSCPLMCSILKKRRVARLNQQEVVFDFAKWSHGRRWNVDNDCPESEDGLGPNRNL
jgi:hypothetical protein